MTSRTADSRWLWIASVLGAVLTPLIAGLYRHRAGAAPHSLGQGFPLDDSWIHAQFALNASRGAPLQYEPGTFSSGSTAPLWSLIEGLGLIVSDDPVLVGHLLGTIFAVAAVVMTVRLARRLGLSGPLLLLVPLAMACEWRFTWAALSGMEVTLAALLVVTWFHVYLDERDTDSLLWRSAGLAALLLWTRPEGLLAAAVMGLDQTILLLVSESDERISRSRRLRRALSFIAVWSAIAVPLFAFNASVGPGPLPQTVYAKAHAVPLERGWRLLWSYPLELAPVSRSALGFFWQLLFVGAACWAAARRLLECRREQGGALLVLFVLAFFAGIAFLKGTTDHYSRYLLPVLPLFLVLSLDGLQQALAAFGRLEMWLLGIAGALLVSTATPSVIEGAETYALNVESVNGHVVEAGRWADRHIPDDAVLSMSDVGAMAYFTENPVVDMRGLISSYHGWDRLAELDRQRRENVAFALLFPVLNERVILRGRYTPLHVFTLDRNNISASDNLVVYATPWSEGRDLTPIGSSFDFETEDLDGWLLEGVFTEGLVEGAGDGQRRVINLGGGQYLLSSWGQRGDRDRGHAISPSFLIEGDIITLRVGGGQLPGRVGVRLWSAGRIERTAIGENSEVLVQREWDVSALRGESARLELFDDTADGWGHIMLDEVRQWRVSGERTHGLIDAHPSGPQEPEASRRAAEVRGLVISSP